MKLLELFSGTHSIGKVAIKQGYEVISLDRDLSATVEEDIMDWNYKIYPPKHFDIITASPVCLWWSILRNTWIGRKCKTIHPTETITMEIINNDVDVFGKPMVDKVIEIIKYFQPKYWWIENPQTGKMKNYIESIYPEFNTYYDVDYCQYSDWGYKKKTRFWTNIKDFKPKVCNKNCNNLVDGKHKHRMGSSKTIKDNGKIIVVNTASLRLKYKDFENIQPKMEIPKTTKNERYRIPPKLIEELLFIIN
tara:strand:+ start:5431 stop:6177 length:747 start_codon:yes stop_codon:yes gene_type:complete